MKSRMKRKIACCLLESDLLVVIYGVSFGLHVADPARRKRQGMNACSEAQVYEWLSDIVN
jgi:hypothetical protein